ncbi:paramyosin-like [Paramacrobiotus metropolitanus]|uniref:paramyosin-like n=1 Tax=Paramacrobiotus metropolitanus TaxID=2943436 RepID=UPI0024456274|nr:paramyosin-like [Paramacrobiotus metropolitanus]
MLTEKAQSFAKRASDLEQEHLCLLEKDKKRLEEQLKWESIIAQQQQEIESLRRKVTECDGSLEVQDNKLKDKMIQTMATKLEETAKELASKNFALDNLKGSLQKKAAEIASLNGRCARFSAEVEAAVKLTIDKLEDRFVPERERFQQTQKALNEELKKLRAAYADQKTELDSLKDTLLETGGALSDEKACAKNLTADNEKLTVKLKQREEQVWQVTAKKDKEIVELNLRCENSANEVLQVTAEKDKEIAELNLRFENSASEVLQVTAKKDKEIAELNMRCMIAANDLETAQGTIAQLREQLNCCQKAQADKDEKVSRLQGVLEQLRQSRERSEPKSLPATDTRTVDPAVKLNDSVPPVVESDATHTLNKDLPKSVSGTASAETTLPTTSAVQTKTSFVQPVASSSVEAVRPASLSKPTSSGSATPTEPVHPVVHPSARDAARPYPKPSRGRGARRRGNQLVYRGNSNRGIPHPPHHGAYFGHGHGLPQDFADDSFSWGDRTYW